jgi:hypothetical protein
MQKKGPNVVCLTLCLLGLYMVVFNTIDIMSLQEWNMRQLWLDYLQNVPLTTMFDNSPTKGSHNTMIGITCQKNEL